MNTFLFLPESVYRILRAFFRYKVAERRVFFLAIQLHGTQKRRVTGKPYWFHLDDVAGKIAQLSSSTSIMVCAALLHDVKEDHNYSSEDILQLLIDSAIMNQSSAEEVVRLVINLSNEFTTEKYPHLNRATRKKLEALRLSECDEETQIIKAADIGNNAPDLRRNDPGFYVTYRENCLTYLQGFVRIQDHPLVLEAKKLLAG